MDIPVALLIIASFFFCYDMKQMLDVSLGESLTKRKREIIRNFVERKWRAAETAEAPGISFSTNSIN